MGHSNQMIDSTTDVMMQQSNDTNEISTTVKDIVADDVSQQSSTSSTMCIYLQLCSKESNYGGQDDDEYWEIYIQPITYNDNKNSIETCCTFLFQQITKLLSLHPARLDDDDDEYGTYDKSLVDDHEDDFVFNCCDSNIDSNIGIDDPGVFDDADEEDDNVEVTKAKECDLNDISTTVVPIQGTRTSLLTASTVAVTNDQDDTHNQQKVLVQRERILVNDNDTNAFEEDDVVVGKGTTDDVSTEQERQEMLDRLDRMLLVPPEYELGSDVDDDDEENSSTDMNETNDAVFSDNDVDADAIDNDDGQFDDAE